VSLDVERSSPEQAASDLLRRWYAAWNAHDVDAISALMTDDVLYEDPGATEPLTRGREPVEDWARTAFRAVPDMHLASFQLAGAAASAWPSGCST
jgi:ketosteroid isomerase-like protein